MNRSVRLHEDLLTPLGYGYPLLHPEANPKTGEIRIGDVGFLKDGYFILLFNCLSSKDDPVNKGRRIPEEFIPFIVNADDIEELPNYVPTQLCSETMKVKRIMAEDTGYGPNCF